MKCNVNTKIEFILGDRIRHTGLRRVYYRAVPSELPLLKRIFCGWMSYPMFQCGKSDKSYHLYEAFNLDEFHELSEKLKTWGDVCDYLEEQKRLAREKHDKLLKNGAIWPDE